MQSPSCYTSIWIRPPQVASKRQPDVVSCVLSLHQEAIRHAGLDIMPVCFACSAGLVFGRQKTEAVVRVDLGQAGVVLGRKDVDHHPDGHLIASAGAIWFGGVGEADE